MARLCELSQKRELEILDLGARVHADERGWLIGRLVPSGTTPPLMFDTRPLPVDEQTARDVATSSAGAWVKALETAFRDGRLDRSVLRAKHREVVTDVPSLGLVEVGTPAAALESTMRQLRSGRDEVGRASFRILRSVADGSLCGDELAPYVAAAALNAHAYPETCRRILGPGQAHVWTRWSELVAEPARGRLRRLAELSVAAAA